MRQIQNTKIDTVTHLLSDVNSCTTDDFNSVVSWIFLIMLYALNLLYSDPSFEICIHSWGERLSSSSHSSWTLLFWIGKELLGWSSNPGLWVPVEVGLCGHSLLGIKGSGSWWPSGTIGLEKVGGVVCQDFWDKLVHGMKADLEWGICTECVELDQDLDLRCDGTAVAGTSVVDRDLAGSNLWIVLSTQ